MNNLDYTDTYIFDLNNDTIQKGIFGINIHRSHEKLTVDKIDKYSAGCQVFNNNIEFIKNN